MNAPNRRRARPSSPSAQADLFAAPTGLLEGFRYHPGVLSIEKEEALARQLEYLPFKPFDFHGYLANRRVVGFGYRYEYGSRVVAEAAPFPPFIVAALTAKIAETFGPPADAFRQVLINEYRPGAGIGWRRDKAQFDEVVGVSLLTPARCASAGRQARVGTARR